MIDDPDKLTDLASADPANEDAAPTDLPRIEAADQGEIQPAGTSQDQLVGASPADDDITSPSAFEIKAAQENAPEEELVEELIEEESAGQAGAEEAAGDTNAGETEFADTSEIDATEIDEEDVDDEEVDDEEVDEVMSDEEQVDVEEAAELEDEADDDLEEGEENLDDEDLDDENLVDEDLVDESERVEMDWYILKVQSNRERSIAEALQRKIAIEGLDRFFGQVIVPTEKVTEFKGGKKRIVERKLWPGYIVVNMHINDDTWFAVRETSGIGDFTGAAGKPTPMQAHEVAKIVQQEQEESEEAPKLAIKFKTGDRIKVKEGNFENFEGEVGSIDEASGRVTVMINIFGRSTPVELEYWQIDAL